jgi:TldD protein
VPRAGTPDYLLTALQAASDSGATYADVREVFTESQSLATRGSAIESVDSGESLGYGVRVLAKGAWGYAASARAGDGEAAAAVARRAVAVARASATAIDRPVELVPEPTHVDEWSTPVERDPFEVSLEEKFALLLAASDPLERSPGIRAGKATLDLIRSRTTFASTQGSRIVQTTMHSGAAMEATAVADGDAQSRSYPGSFRGHLGAGGFEVIEALDLSANVARTADEAAALLTAPACPDGRFDLVLDGHQVMLQLHESIGHPTELDRVLGMEASYAGTSWVGVDDLGKLRYGSEHVNVTADATTPGGLGTARYDDEGVEAQRVDLIRDGILVGMQSSRETAAALGADRSNGTMRADGWENFPLIRMTNINLLPGDGTLEDLISEVDYGIYMATNKSWSIDDKRKNFQFACEIAWEIKNGELGRMLKNPRYTGITQDFWSSCDGIAGESEWFLWGTPNCGKGQPGQVMRVGHGTSPARFRGASIGVGD